MLTYIEIKSAFEQLNLADRPVIVHASLKKFGEIDGGPRTMLRALMACFGGLVMPTFTYKTMVTPGVGPPNNGISYGADGDKNKMAEPFRFDMPADKMMGTLPEMLRKHPSAVRTTHPILSFAGFHTDDILITQIIPDPFAPIGALAEQGGWVLLLGVNHTVNTSVHYAEKLAGRKQFIRWALTDNRVAECPGFPGDSEGFGTIADDLKADTRIVEIGAAHALAVPLARLFDAVTTRIKQDPLALLCQREDCERCNAVRSR